MIEIVADLPVELYPLAWLVGRWRGYAVAQIGDRADQAMIQEIKFTHDGGDYLRQHTTFWRVEQAGNPVPQGADAAAGQAFLTAAEIWHTNTAYWRVLPDLVAEAAAEAGVDEASGVASEAGTAGTGGEAGVKSTQRELEVASADPAGFVAIWVGVVNGARIQLATDAMVRTASAPEIAASTRMFGLVNGELYWVEENHFNNERESVYSGCLARV